MIIKKLSFLILILLSISIQGQESKIDTSNIAFKAKLMTMFRTGVNDSTSLVKKIQSQKIEFVENPSKSIILMKIIFNQNVILSKNEGRTVFGSCNYYIAFNNSNSKFYRIGGFDNNDVIEFIEDMGTYSSKMDEALLFYNLNNVYGDFDMECISIYSELSERKRKKRGYKCFKKCSKELFTDWKNILDDKK